MSDYDALLSLPILVADDDADDRLLLKMAFAEQNIPNPVLFFKDGSEVTDYLYNIDSQSDIQKDLPGLMLLDVNMPRKNGLQVLKEVKTHPIWQQICVCMFSTARTEHYVSEAHQLGADNYMVKPDSYDDLLEVIQSVYLTWLNSVLVSRKIHPCSMEKENTPVTHK